MNTQGFDAGDVTKYALLICDRHHLGSTQSLYEEFLTCFCEGKTHQSRGRLGMSLTPQGMEGACHCHIGQAW